MFVFLIAFSANAQVPESRWAMFEKSRIHYYDIGNQKSRSALVFIHGWTCSAEFWKHSMNAFPEYRVIVVDLVGHGQSERPNAIYSMEFFARSVDAVLNKARIGRAVFVGHSMGTPVARQYFRLFPAKTAGIVIADGALRPFMSSEDFERVFAPVRSNYVKNVPAFLDGMLRAIKDTALRDWIRERMLAARAQVALSAMDGMGDPGIWAADKINVPVLALLAESEFWKPDEEAYFRSIAPDLEFHLWKDVSHFLMLERPAEFNERIRTFVAKRSLL